MKKDKLITMKINRLENEKIEFLCKKLDMNRSQLFLYLCDLKYIDIIKESDKNE